MKLLATALATLLLLQPVLAASQPTSGPTSAPTSQPSTIPFPPGTRLTLRQGTLQGFNLAEFKMLLRIHADYRALWTQVPLLRKSTKQYQALAGNLSKQLKLQGEESNLLRAERTRLAKKWQEENRLRHLAENKPSIMTWLGWGSAAVMGIVATVLAIVLAVDRD